MPGLVAGLEFRGIDSGVQSDSSLEKTGPSPATAARRAEYAAKRQTLVDQLAEARKQLSVIEDQEKIYYEQLPGSQVNDDKLSFIAEQEKAFYEAQQKRNDELEVKRAANRVILAEVRSEAQNLSAQHKELISDKAASSTVFTKALDTPVQSAIYTIQSLLHEHRYDKATTDQLSTILRQLTAANPYMPTFNFASADLADETKNWIAKTFSGAIDEETSSPSVVHQQPATPTADKSVMLELLQTLEFNCWDYKEEELDSFILQMFNKFSLLQTFSIPEDRFKRFVEAVRKGECGFTKTDSLQFVLLCTMSKSSDMFADHIFTNLPFYHHLQVAFALCSGDAVKQLRPLEILAMFITALCVDIDHGGVSDQFLINTRSPLAQLYNDRSVNENHHCTFTWKLLSKEDSNILCKLPQDQWREARKLIVQCFLGTDMARHFDVLTKFKLRVDSDQFSSENKDDRAMLMNVVVHASDLSNLCRSYELAFKWAKLKVEELWRQGDTEKNIGQPVSPMCDRKTNDEEIHQMVATMQVDYCDYVVGPMFEQLQAVLGDKAVIGDGLRHMRANREKWAQMRGDMVNDMASDIAIMHRSQTIDDAAKSGAVVRDSSPNDVPAASTSQETKNRGEGSVTESSARKTSCRDAIGARCCFCSRQRQAQP